MKIYLYEVPIENIGSMSHSLFWDKAILKGDEGSIETSQLQAKAQEVADYNKSRLLLWKVAKPTPQTILQKRIR